jgi:hypothetical protein
MADTWAHGETICVLITNPEINGDKANNQVWHWFPTTTEALQESLAKIRLDGMIHRKYSIQVLDTAAEGLAAALPRDANLDELNYLAARLTYIEGDALATFKAAMQSGAFRSMHDIINVTENLDCFYLEPALDARMLGEYQSDMDREDFTDHIGALMNSGKESDREFADYIERIESCLNHHAYGKAKADKEHGHFTKAGYLTRTKGDYVEVYNTPSDIPQEYRVFAYPDADMIRTAAEHKEGNYEYAAGTNGEIKPDSSSIVDYLIKNKQQAKEQPPTPKRDGEPTL